MGVWEMDGERRGENEGKMSVRKRREKGKKGKG